jgi:hypothetical protein
MKYEYHCLFKDPVSQNINQFHHSAPFDVMRGWAKACFEGKLSDLYYPICITIR